ncbi:DHA1 family bicyclomycin/chloramphenicol resistance-like MFS transporter [Microbacterium natoriense]|uniref:DHA1 family bicyclomycin/chloramphenicol resistance-like MFS transporter n=1 Tax=Microbacterium natoriense TaxID=284570 RepID=A0AAW8EU87_9MICO|nr:multidrug effflux MFS transporter [Microbacterium natoriense]MDQ0646793.1 DHA1 family bicyclomycin/chloramphenicol resistance-like MFS transporter [Microbacterium natoriense]
MTTSSRSLAQRILPALLLLLTVFGPISMDLYLPALPALTLELSAATSVAQLTVTACLVGLAAGQLIAGPLSDRYGRRGILLIGIVAYIATSLLCAASPSIELLIAARLVQGLTGGVGIVIAQAAGRDVYAGGALIRFYGRLTVVGGFAAIVGPLIGGLLNSVTDWRGLFVFLAAIGAVILLTTLIAFDETLPIASRTAGGLGRTLSDFRTLASDRVFLGAILNQGFLYAALFAYLSGATFVLQDIYGLSPLGYALAFGANSAGFMVLGFVAGRTAGRSLRGTLSVGIVVAGAGALGLLASGLTRMPLWVVLVSLFLLAGGAAVTSPPATTIALVEYPQIAGTASSLLGMVRYGFGGIAAPLVGVAGATSILPLGIVTVTSLALAALAFVFLVRPARVPQPIATGTITTIH